MSSSINAPAAAARLILNIGLIAMIVAAIAGGLQFKAAGGRVLSVQTGSMVPSFRPGDAVIVWHVVPAALKVGDIVSYHSSRDPAVIVTHRLVAIHGSQLITRGDALQVSDPPIADQAVIGRATAVAPHLGWWLGRLRTPLGLAVAVYIPATLLIIGQVRHLARSLQQTRYRLYAR